MFVKEAGVTSSTPTFDTTIAAISPKNPGSPKNPTHRDRMFPCNNSKLSYPCETNEDGKTSNDLDMSWWSVSPRIGVTTQPGVKVHSFERSTMRLMSRFLNACLHVAVLKMQIWLWNEMPQENKQEFRFEFELFKCQKCKLSADYATTPL